MSNVKTVSCYTTIVLIVLCGLLIIHYNISHKDSLAQTDKVLKFPTYVRFWSREYGDVHLYSYYSNSQGCHSKTSPLCLYLEDGTAVVCPIYKKHKPSAVKNPAPYPAQVVMETYKIPNQITIWDCDSRLWVNCAKCERRDRGHVILAGVLAWNSSGIKLDLS